MFLTITIDVESPQTPLMNGKINKFLMELDYDGIPLGTSFILEELKKQNLHGVFFINVYESAVWGASPVAQLCKKIFELNHEVALHTHPACMFDYKRQHMWQYTKDEQIQIISKGLELIHQWLPGYSVVSHRAGAYGLNEDTMDALFINSIKVDSSMFYKHPNCKVYWNKNIPEKRNQILEIPITGFYYKFKEMLKGLPFSPSKKFVKTDINWVSIDELYFFVNEAKKHKIDVMNLFMHSYSFARFNKDFTQYVPNYADMDKLHEFLSLVIKDPDIQVVSMRDLYYLSEDERSLFNSFDYIPMYFKKNKLTEHLLKKLISLFKKID